MDITQNIGNTENKHENQGNEGNAMHGINMPEDMPKLILSIGSNAARYMLKSLVTHYNRSDLLDRIDLICSVQELGCYQIDYTNKFSNEKEIAYILIAPCTEDHDLTEQLDRLRVYVSSEEWATVLKSLSTLILLTRSIYNSVYMDNKDMFNEVTSDDTNLDYSTLQVDMSNTTLYLPNVSERIGIYLEKS
jgi:hypothetical protein